MLGVFHVGSVHDALEHTYPVRHSKWMPISDETRSLNSPTFSSKAAFSTGAGTTDFTTDLTLPGSPLACFRAASLARSSHPRSPARSPPLSADWHSDARLHAAAK